MIVRRTVLAGAASLAMASRAYAFSMGAGGVGVRLKTTAGDIDLELAAEQAPKTVANFLRYADQGLYARNGSFYRTVRPQGDVNATPINIIQGGLFDPNPPFDGIAIETTRDTGLTHVDGTLSMARKAPGWSTPLATSEFFVCIGDAKALDFGGARNADGQGFAAFGRVARGMEVVRAIHVMPTGAEMAGTIWAGQILHTPVRITGLQRL
jgi:peptidyl-prolyl cis-trans isomerase A (cyclophilin A)